MFEQASRIKLTFNTEKGTLLPSDLWDLPLQESGGVNLDKLAQYLRKELGEAEEESFIKPKTASNSLLRLKFDIVVHIIKVKLAERDDRIMRSQKQAEKDKLIRALANKENEEMSGLSKEELIKKIADID